MPRPIRNAYVRREHAQKITPEMRDALKQIASKMLKSIYGRSGYNFKRDSESFKREICLTAMALSDNNIALAAAMLNINRTTLTEMLKRWNSKPFQI